MVVLPSRLEIPNPMPVETMATTINQRFKSGQTCRETGTYEVDGYVDGSSNPLPSADDMRIILSAGDEFPRLGSLERACYW